MKKQIFNGMLTLGFLTFMLVSCSDQNDTAVIPDQTESNSRSLKQVLQFASQSDSDAPAYIDEDFADECIESYDCFDYVFPIMVTNSTGEVVELANLEELYQFYDEQPGNDNDLEEAEPFVFPITIRMTDGSERVIANSEELDAAYDDCIGFDGDVCFDYDFPITLSDGNGNTITVTNETEIQNFYEGLSEDADPEFVFPITIILVSDGSTVTINNDNEFDEVYGECFGMDDFDDFEDFDCFELQFPIQATTSAGGEVTLASEDELEEYFENLEDNEVPNITFPITIVYTDGSTKKINSWEEAEMAFDDCFIGEEDSLVCFDFTYPMQLMQNGGQDNVTVANDDELDAFLDELGEADDFDIIYPITVLLSDGSTQVVNNDEELFGLAESCE